MIVLRGAAASWPALTTPTALAVGVFDGLHSGHRAVLAALRQHAAARGLVPGVVTFDPHPLAVVAPERAPAMLTDVAQRLELLAAEGAEVVAVVEFDAATRNWTPERFAVGLLAETLAARVVLAGEDFRFGRDRSGDVVALGALGARHGFDTVVVPLVGGERPASSRALRALVAAGDVVAVAAELGRPHELRVRLAAPGLLAAAPTGMAVPAAGLYAGVVGRTATEAIPAAITVGDHLAVRLLGSDPGLGGSDVALRFVAPMPSSSSDDAIRTAADPRTP